MIARPGGNMTGFANFFGSLGGKWLEVFKEAVPGLTRVAHIVSTIAASANPRAEIPTSMDAAAARLEVTVTGGDYFLEYPDLAKATVCAALIARERFRKDGPAWAQPLPLHEDCFEALQKAERPRGMLLGYFSESLSDVSWDYELHPRFNAFAAGMLAYESTPVELRSDPELRAEFPPRPLEGLCDGKLCWRPAAKIAAYRDMRRRVAEAEAASAAGR
jgi:hypothetical protein